MNFINKQDELIYKKLLAMRNVASLTFDLYIYRTALGSLKSKAQSNEFKKFIFSLILKKRLKECIQDAIIGHADFAITPIKLKHLRIDAEGLIAKYDNIQNEIMSLEGEIYRYLYTFYDIGSLPIELGKLYSTDFDEIRGLYCAREEVDTLIGEIFKLTPFRYGSDEWEYCLREGQKWYFYYVFLGGHTIKDIQDTLLDEFINVQVTNKSNSKYISDIVKQHLAHGANINPITYMTLLKGAFKEIHPRQDESAPTRYNILSSIEEAGYYNIDVIIEFINESFSQVELYEDWNLDLMLYNIFAACVNACPLNKWLSHFIRLLLKISDAEVYIHRIISQANIMFHNSIISIFEETYEHIKNEKVEEKDMKMKPKDDNNNNF